MFSHVMVGSNDIERSRLFDRHDGGPHGPLAGVFRVPLDLPWILWLDVRPSALLTTATIAASALNLLPLRSLCRWRALR